MKASVLRLVLAATMSLPTLPLLGCLDASTPLQPSVVPPPRIPPLPQVARQPKTPELCLPTCSAGLTRLRDSLLQSPKSAASQALPASAPMTR